MKKNLVFVVIFLTSLIAFSQGSGNGLSFSGSDKAAYIVSDADIDFAGWDDFTISGWFYFSNNSNFQTIFNKTANVGAADVFNIHIDVSPASRFRFNLSREGQAWEVLTSNTVLPNNTWVHFACVKSLNITYLYLNGVLDNTLTITNAFTGTLNTGVNVNIGRLRRDNTYYYRGRLDEMCIFRTALSQAEIREWMCKTITASHPQYANLVSYIKMNEGIGGSYADASGNGNNAYAVVGGAATWIVSGAPIGDESVFNYPANWLGQTLTYSFTVGDELSISDLSSSGNSGAHIYYVGSNPNSTTGISDVGSTTSYYGVYLTDFAGNYSVSYNYADYTISCETCNPLYARNDNAVTSWTPVDASHGSCTASAINESIVDQIFRSEYFVSIQNLDVDLGPDSQFCDGGSQVLDATLLAGSTYLWNDASTNPTLSVSSSGTYDVEVYYEGCTILDDISITVDPNPIISFTGVDINCNGDNTGEISATVTSGTGPFGYLWDTGATTSDLTGLTAGTYALDVTDDNGCTASDSFTLTEPTDALTSIISSSSDVVCFAESNGSASVLASGGTPTYSYLWSNGQSTDILTSVVAGTYSVVVTDLNNCTSTSSVTITEPAELTGIISGTNSSCAGAADGEVSIAMSGGTGSYYYTWSSGGTTGTESNLDPGNYTVIVTDDNSCSFTDNITISQPQPLSLSITLDNATCNGFADGQASAVVAGGTIPYSYDWSSGGTAISETGLIAGTFTITVTDDNNCTITNSFDITEPDLLVLSIDHTDILCYGDANGTATANISGGTLDYEYEWSNSLTTSGITGLSGGLFSLTLTDDNSCTISESVTILEPTELLLTPSFTDVSCYGLSDGTADVVAAGGTSPYYYEWSGGETTSGITGLVAGHYEITITDENDCVISDDITISQPDELIISFTTTDANCGNPDGSASVNPSGGTPIYNYQWDAAASDQTSQLAINLMPGTYSVTVIDNNFCEAIGNVTVGEIGVPIPSLVNIIHNPCFEDEIGSIEVEVASGGTAPFTFDWSEGSSGSLVTNLAAGFYTVTITDTNSCSSVETYTVSEPSELTTSIANVINLLCYGDNSGSAQVIANGGTAAYSYLWSDIPGSSTDIMNNVSGGWYFVSVSDLNGCETIDSVEIFEPANYYLTFNTMAENCGLNDGEATITPVGGTPSYSYIWETTDTDSTITALATGNYSVTVSDLNGCTITQTVFVDIQGVGNLSLNLLSGIKCFNEASGSIAASVTGGAAPYNFLWNNGDNNDTLTMLMAGEFIVTVTDGNGCIITDTLEITQPDQLSIDITVSNALCSGDSTGFASATISGGIPPYEYLWSNGQTDTIATGLVAGGYSITVTDDNNCTRIRFNIAILQPFAIDISIDTLAEIQCFGSNEGVLNAVATGGTEPYSYLWESGDTNSMHSNLTSGNYFLTLTDAHNCYVVSTSVLDQPDLVSVSIDSIASASCLGNNDGFIRVIVEGGIGEYSYIWSNNALTNTAENLSAGTYYLTINDENNCISTGEFLVGELSGSCIEIPSAFTPNNDGVNDYFEIKNVHLLEEVEVEIYNRWGQLMFIFIGTGYEYAQSESQWDGKYNGVDVALGTYVFIVKLSGVLEPYNGVVTVIR